MKKVLKINTAWCRGCGICAAFCPKGALEMKNGKVSVTDKPCTLCGLCELRCPDFAIYVQEEEEK